MEYIDFSKPENETITGDYFTIKLLEQEVAMYLSLGKEVEQEDLDFISTRRGFSINEKNYLIRCLKDLNIGSKLNYDKPR